jgi:hypothetical protein
MSTSLFARGDLGMEMSQAVYVALAVIEMHRILIPITYGETWRG